MRLHPPRIEIAGTADAMAERAAQLVIATLRSTGVTTLGLATGATMAPLYARLAAMNRAGEISFRNTFSFNLDEYVGVPPQSPASFHATMKRHLFDHIDIEPGRTHIPDGTARNLAAEARRYEALIAAAGGIDLQLLGIGANGHIGFNEPGSDFASRTREVVLDETTRLGNAGHFPDRASAPERAITMGIATILEARAILLLATGPEKAAAIAAAIEGPLTPACPASALRLHDNVQILCDEAAASALANRPDNGARRAQGNRI
jgi:glucosamine-6-phosphate deaminase